MKGKKKEYRSGNLSKRKVKKINRKREALKKKKEEKARRERIFNTLEEHSISSEAIAKLYSSKELNKDFGRVVLHKEKKKEMEVESELKKAEEVKQKSLISIINVPEIKPKRAFNLFDMVSFSGPSINVGKERVVDEDDIKQKKVENIIKDENMYRGYNPFKTTKLRESNDYSLEEDNERAPEDEILVEIQKLEGKHSLQETITLKKTAKSKGNELDLDGVLPIYKNEFEIMESIKNNLVTIICGETGTGKSTQLPQILKEYKMTQMGMIGVTQPRRLAAISLAK